MSGCLRKYKLRNVIKNTLRSGPMTPIYTVPLVQIKKLPCEKRVSCIFEIVPELLVQLLGNCFRGISLRAPATY
jgi:hypothetical protein